MLQTFRSTPRQSDPVVTLEQRAAALYASETARTYLGKAFSWELLGCSPVGERIRQVYRRAASAEMLVEPRDDVRNLREHLDSERERLKQRRV